jgi:UDP-GlcNAc:undecaprenyl-phosphate GlcNAc-1-phosphate transferase
MFTVSIGFSMEWVTANFRLLFLPFVAAAISGLLTAGTISLCRRRGWVVQPRSDRWHRAPVAQFGGVAIVIAFLAVATPLHHDNRLLVLVGLTTLIGGIGLCDDLRSWKPAAKLAVEFLIAALLVAMGVMYPLTSVPWVNVCVTLTWIVGVTNAFNLLDNMDGLAAGIAMIAGIALSVLTTDAHLRLLTLVFVGAVGGFLLFNFKPAKIFMGDTGSLAIGFYLASASVLAVQHRSAADGSTRLLPALVLFLPLFDTALVSITRRMNGRAISAGARDHTSHRLVVLGISERAAVLLLCWFAALGGMLAIFMARVPSYPGWAILGLFLLASTLFWLHLARLKLPDEYLSRTNVFTFVMPGMLQSLASTAVTVFLDVWVVGLSLSFALKLGPGSLSLPTFVALFCTALLTKLPALAALGMYRRRSTTSLKLCSALAKAAVWGSLAFVAAVIFGLRSAAVSWAVFAADLLLTFLLLATVRFSDPILGRILRPAKVQRAILVNGARSQLAAWVVRLHVPAELTDLVLAEPEDELSGKN